MKNSTSLLVAACLALGCADRRPLPGATVHPRVAAAIDHGAVSPDVMFDLVVGVQLRNQHRLVATHKLLADRNDTLQPDDFGEMFGASPGEYARFVTWLQAAGFEIVRTTPSRTTVTVRGNAAAIAAAFGVEMHSYEDAYGDFTAASSSVTVIANAVGDLTSGVVGLGGEKWHTHLATPNAGTGAQTPQDFQQRYFEDVGTMASPTKPGMGQTVAILSTNYLTKTADLNSYLLAYKPGFVSALAAGQYTQVQVGGPLRDAQKSGEYVENVLDAEMVLATAPYANIVQVFTATNGAGLFTDGIAYIVNTLSNAHTVTVSWGTCERGSAGSMTVMNALFAQAKAEGQQWFFASGDYGVDGCRDGSGNLIFSDGWPASSPYVVGVGGTQPIDANTEMAWSGAGGGPSESFDKPNFQVTAGVMPNDGSRDEPDIAAAAASVAIRDSVTGTPSVGGTSAATPICAGLWATLLQNKKPTGITNGLEEIYTLAKAGKGFTDITSGTTIGPGDAPGGGYMAAAGYDYATGWGTPNLTSLIANWQ